MTFRRKFEGEKRKDFGKRNEEMEGRGHWKVYFSS